jgi:selenocysteine-specific elongation factor
MFVIGTAGHVDHGKSALIAALSGMHPDRLKEEIEREMTIDLGFAWFTLPQGEVIGVIDVPGHRDFIANMLDGIGGIDAVLLVIAADEGMMPQTREHLAILDLLEVSSGVIVINKIDLAEDKEWLDLVEMEIQEALQGTSLEGLPIIKVSAKTQQGLDDLRQALHQVLLSQSSRPDLGRPRLPVDRVFSLPGFGTIVTGTLIDGLFSVGDTIEILPGNLSGRIRGLQTHKQKEEQAVPGSRTGINISGINKAQIMRGQVVVKPGTYQATDLIDAHFRLLKETSSAIKHNMEVVFFSGASEIPSTLRLLGMEVLQPGNSAFIQVKLSEPIVVVNGDHYIIRRPSPPETIGGGIILDSHPQKNHRRFNQQVLTRLDELLKGDPAEIIKQQLERNLINTVEGVIKKTNISLPDGIFLISNLITSKELVRLDHSQEKILPSTLLLTMRSWQKLVDQLTSSLKIFHAQNPLKPGMPREMLRKNLTLPTNWFDLVLSEMSSQRTIDQSGTTIKVYGYEINFSEFEEAKAKMLLQRFQDSPFSPPDFKECQQLVGSDLLDALISLGKLVKVSDEVLFTCDTLEVLVTKVQVHLQNKGSISLAELRDQVNTSRKYALPLLEYLDDLGITLRKGDIRVLKSHK